VHFNIKKKPHVDIFIKQYLGIAYTDTCQYGQCGIARRRYPSKIEYVYAGLKKFVKRYEQMGITIELRLNFG